MFRLDAAEIVRLVLAFAAGIALAAAYFGGLWWTVRRVGRLRRPQFWALCSFVVRLAVVAGGMVLIARLGWPYAAAAMAGFLVLRIVLLGRLRPAPGRAGQEKNG